MEETVVGDTIVDEDDAEGIDLRQDSENGSTNTKGSQNKSGTSSDGSKITAFFRRFRKNNS